MQILAGTANAIASFSYAWDTVGNLASRADTTQGYTENFCYDALNRLTNSAFGAACTGGKTIAYDALGNLTSKSDTGTYNYPAAGQVRPHAVSSIIGTVNGVLNPAFAYDADGNMTSGAGRSVSWTSFNLANQVTQGTTTVAFTYDSEHARIVQSIGGASPSTTTYLNALGAVSEKVVAGTTTVWRDYIYAAGSLVAERYCTGASPCAAGNASMRYMVSDHLGSPSSLTDANGAVTERLSYDAWGMRRNASGSDALCGTIASATTRGFTGHEMMDAVCLVNMNARLYDPAIGRFMSADSIVPDPLNGQSFNRYAYVNDNPLNATDPTGHDDPKHSLPINPCGSSSGCGDQGTLSENSCLRIECVVITGDRCFTECRIFAPDPAHSPAELDLGNPRGEHDGGGGGGGGNAKAKSDPAMKPLPCPQDGTIETVCVTANRPPPILIGPVANPGSSSMFGFCHAASSIARSIINAIPKQTGINTGSASLVAGGGALGFSGQLSFGLVIDRSGNVGVITVGTFTGSGGVVGLSGNVGLNVSGSNGASINSLNNGFANQSLTVGDGLSGGVDAFEGVDMNGQQVRGGGVTVGVGAGLTLNGGASFTDVEPLCDG